MIEVSVGRWYVRYPETKEGIELAKKFLDMCMSEVE